MNQNPRHFNHRRPPSGAGRARLGTIACFLAFITFAGFAAERKYSFYQPVVTEGSIYNGTFGQGDFAYNHMVSIEFFNGLYYGVWGANAATNREGQPGQINVISTSEDFVRWTQPVDLAGPERSENPILEPNAVFWQPNLLNVRNEELWCLWSYGKERGTVHGAPGWGQPNNGKGLYLSRLSAEPGAKWRHAKIMDLVEVDGLTYAPFSSQNPFLCSTGRILAPLTLVHDPRQPGVVDGGSAADRIRMANVCAYTDDDGKTWRLSNLISRVDEPYGQWEPHFWEQADGTIRGIMRNFDNPPNRNLPPVQRQLTVSGGSSKKGTPLVFAEEPEYAYIETGRTRTQVFRSEEGARYYMLGGDSFTPQGARNQCAVYFSRTGTMDFVAGPRYSPRHVYATYSQGIARDGRILTAYTTTENKHQVWRIRTSVIDPAPRADAFYIWTREKHIEGGEEPVYTPPVRLQQADGRQALHFRMRGSAGVETDPIDFERGESVTVRFEVKVLEVQPRGNLVICSFGDKIPIRLGMPGDRPGQLYAYGRNEWQPVGELPIGAWCAVEVTFSRDSFRVSTGQASRSFPNPIVAPTPKLYLGNGFEVDEHPANQGSQFLIDLGAFRTVVK